MIILVRPTFTPGAPNGPRLWNDEPDECISRKAKDGLGIAVLFSLEIPAMSFGGYFVVFTGRIRSVPVGVAAVPYRFSAASFVTFPGPLSGSMCLQHECRRCHGHSDTDECYPDFHIVSLLFCFRDDFAGLLPASSRLGLLPHNNRRETSVSGDMIGGSFDARHLRGRRAFSPT